MIHAATLKRLKTAVPLLLKWYATNQRSFIWRGIERTPYQVLISEFMLQQTGARYVEKRLPEFLAKFPTVKKLAAAQRADVLRAWQGLGYNRRALNLHNAAKAIDAVGSFPETLEALLALPGIGRYTASAVLAFAHNADVPVVDVNIERVLSRWWKGNEKIPIRNLYELDAAILPKGRSSEWHQAVMDLGSTICTKRNPKCEVCPENKVCRTAFKVKENASTKSKEKEYWSQARRVWRGRILKIVTNAEPISRKKIILVLQNQYSISDTAFLGFVASVIGVLEQEGFMLKKKGVYLLAHG
ncbi:MAG TPA: A/G-specific adenine glycosylase [Candidatus Kapabacteria bacterium]|jgi:A/G-specific adenine glycosylase